MKFKLKSLLIGTLTGTVVMFLWGATEWFNPFMQQPYKKVTNPTALHESLQQEIPENGVYIWPNGPDSKTSDGQARDLVYFMVKQDASFYNPGKFMLIELLTQLLTWFLITYLLLSTGLQNHSKRIRLVCLFAVLVGLGYFLPMWNWWGFSTEYVLTRWLNLLIGWVLAGTSISYFLRKHIQTSNQ
ncbi:MAG: hypothetical protein AAFQ94_00335 [Bacteroidota bacterium]